MMYCGNCGSNEVKSVFLRSHLGWHVGWRCSLCGHVGARSGEDIKADNDTDEALEASANEG